MNVGHQLIVFGGTAVLDVGWTAAVRLATSRRLLQVFAIAVAMQGISYLNTIIVVDDHATSAIGMLGAGIGAVIGALLPDDWFKKKQESVTTDV